MIPCQGCNHLPCIAHSSLSVACRKCDDCCGADWEGEASKAAAIATKEEEAVLERHSMDATRHPENGLRQPLLAIGEAQHDLGQEGQTEACCRGDAASDMAPIAVTAKCGAAAAPGEAEASSMLRIHGRDVHDG